MRTLEKTIGLLVFHAFLLFSNSAFALEASPVENVKALLGIISQIKVGDAISQEQNEKNQKHCDKAIAFLDIKDVSQQTLGKYWNDLSPKEREDFSILLSNLFKKIAFPNSAKFFADFKIVYGEAKVNKDKAVVPIKVLHKSEGEIGIDFKLQSGEGLWRVYDVILDEVSMRNNLKSQFHKILEKEAYKGLVSRMKEKVEKGE